MDALLAFFPQALALLLLASLLFLMLAILADRAGPES
jgi:hypothetical protein